MKKIQFETFRILLLLFTDIVGVFVAFWLAYLFRQITDGIPFVQLRVPYISPEHFAPFVLAGVTLWVFVFLRGKLYSHIHRPIFEEIRRVMTYSFFWFFVFIGFVYLTQGFLFFKDIPRLIILYALLIAMMFSVLVRIVFYQILQKLYQKNLIKKQKILIIESQKDDPIVFDLEKIDAEYTFAQLSEANRIESIIRNNQIDAILLASGEFSDPKMEGIIALAGIYGIRCVHPIITPKMRHFSREETFIAGIPVVMLSTVSITPFESIIKRIIDIILAVFFIILTSPLMIIAAIAIKLEDPSWPIIYRNRRIGQGGKLFSLFKFRYMYWKYCTKEDYLEDGEKDEAIVFEELLKKEKNDRQWPLYKIKNDPRKMRFGSILEKFSIDELPQLFNVLIGNMSLIWPRPHQPREVELYDESDKQVLTIKPGITGMAQVYGRDKNTFKEEVLLDTYYIENYSIFLDFIILLRTIVVVLRRPFEKHK